MKRKLTVFVYDGMSRVGTALKAYDDVCGIGKSICDLPFSLVSPVCTYDSFNHMNLLRLSAFCSYSFTLYVYFSLLAQKFLIGFEHGRDHLYEESLHLMGRASDIARRIHGLLQFLET